MAVSYGWQRILDNVSRTRLILAASAIAVGLPVFRYLQDDYRKWYSLGQGGVPRNLVGYLFVTYFGRYADHDVDSTIRYVAEGNESELERTSFFDGPVPIRAGPRPNVTRWIAPVRQLSGMSPEDVKQELLSSILTHVDGTTITAGPSSIEGGTSSSNALSVAGGDQADSDRRFATRGPREFYHVHPSEGSAHAIVSAADAKILVETGWSERHPLAGASRGGFPSNYIHVYAPRTLEEIAVHQMVARAAARYHLRKDISKDA